MEPALKHVTDFSKRETLVIFLPKKKKKIPETHPSLSIRAQKLFISLCSSGKRPDSEFEASETFHCAVIIAIDVGDKNLERVFQRGYL